MKFSSFLIPTLRNIPSDAELTSHRFFLKGGYIKKVAAGIYDYMPLGLRVIRKIEKIIRQEMNKKGGQEVCMPSVIPAELWQKSGRWNIYGKELLRIKDRANRDFLFGPTHEEVIVDLVDSSINSYKQLPINLYQIQTKFRDEIRPRFGLMRAREFTMKDAYSFHQNIKSLDVTYEDMFNAYTNIFKRCGLSFRVVDADSGNIGGNTSQEFMITAESGEDEIFYCNDCNYAANLEKATTIINNHKEPHKKLVEVHTPDQISIEQVSNYLEVPINKIIKSLIFVYGNYELEDEKKFVMICIRGDYELNENKLRRVLDCDYARPADKKEIQDELGLPVGYLGPRNIKSLTILADISIKNICNAVIGSNEKNYHYLNVTPKVDFKCDKYVDINVVGEKDPCPKCGNNLKREKGIEVGHIFKLGTKYSESMKATFLDENGKKQLFVMGCYGIGVGRTAMAAIEQFYDKYGPVWPISIAPFEVIVVPVNAADELMSEVSHKIYEDLLSEGIDVLLDNREERFGVKLNDADLIGAPIRIIIGKQAYDKFVELNYRAGEKKPVLVKNVVVYVKEFIEAEKMKLNKKLL